MKVEESRRPLDAVRLAGALAAAGWSGPAPLLLEVARSTAQVARRLADDDAPDGAAVVAECVTEPDLGAAHPAGPPAGGVLWVSSVVRAGRESAPAAPGWLVLAASLALADALRASAGVPVEAEWPDAVSIPGAMCGGSAGPRRVGTIRVDGAEGALILTLAVNVTPDPLALPAGATSLLADGGAIDRTAVLAALLPAIGRRVAQWRNGDPALPGGYRQRCRTIGRLVEQDGQPGHVVGVDEEGALVVRASASR